MLVVIFLSSQLLRIVVYVRFYASQNQRKSRKLLPHGVIARIYPVEDYDKNVEQTSSIRMARFSKASSEASVCWDKGPLKHWQRIYQAGIVVVGWILMPSSKFECEKPWQDKTQQITKHVSLNKGSLRALCHTGFEFEGELSLKYLERLEMCFWIASPCLFLTITVGSQRIIIRRHILVCSILSLINPLTRF